MGRLLKLLLLCTLLLLLACPVAVYYLVLSDKPMTLQTQQLVQQDLVALQRQLAKQLARPDGQGRVTLRLNQKDVDTAINFGLQAARVPLLEGASLELGQEHATLSGAVHLPLDMGRNFINYRARLIADDKQPHITRLQLGYLSVPTMLLQWLEGRAMTSLYEDERLASYRKTWESVDQVAIADQHLSIVYRIDKSTIEGMVEDQKKLVLAQIDTAAIELYLARLEPIIQQRSSQRQPLTALLGPAYDLARERSARGFDPVKENSTALLSLAMYAADPTVLRFMGLDDRLDPVQHIDLTLHRRSDLARHFLTAAVISLFAGDRVADVMGMQKELNDSQSPSGFGLADLVADKAGIRFAELATRSPASALRLQQQLENVLYDDQLLPDPDAMLQRDLENELARVSDSELEAYLADIDRQINNLLRVIPLYQR